MISIDVTKILSDFHRNGIIIKSFKDKKISMYGKCDKTVVIFTFFFSIKIWYVVVVNCDANILIEIIVIKKIAIRARMNYIHFLITSLFFLHL